MNRAIKTLLRIFVDSLEGGKEYSEQCKALRDALAGSDSEHLTRCDCDVCRAYKAQFTKVKP